MHSVALELEVLSWAIPVLSDLRGSEGPGPLPTNIRLGAVRPGKFLV